MPLMQISKPFLIPAQRRCFILNHLGITLWARMCTRPGIEPRSPTLTTNTRIIVRIASRAIFAIAPNHNVNYCFTIFTGHCSNNSDHSKAPTTRNLFCYVPTTRTYKVKFYTHCFPWWSLANLYQYTSVPEPIGLQIRTIWRLSILTCNSISFAVQYPL
jgi:hypothetical protein